MFSARRGAVEHHVGDVLHVVVVVDDDDDGDGEAHGDIRIIIIFHSKSSGKYDSWAITWAFTWPRNDTKCT